VYASNAKRATKLDLAKSLQHRALARKVRSNPASMTAYAATITPGRLKPYRACSDGATFIHKFVVKETVLGIRVQDVWLQGS
jgi:hypothetical protein